MVHVPLMFMSEWRKFPSAPCLAGKKTWWQLMSPCWNCASPDMLPFSLCNKKRLAIRHMNRPLFPTTLSIPSYDIGKYLTAPPHIDDLLHVQELLKILQCIKCIADRSVHSKMEQLVKKLEVFTVCGLYFGYTECITCFFTYVIPA